MAKTAPPVPPVSTRTDYQGRQLLTINGSLTGKVKLICRRPQGYTFGSPEEVLAFAAELVERADEWAGFPQPQA